MNKVNFLNKDNFPLYSEGLAKLQSAIFMTANLALLGGSNYILSGCIDDGKGNVSDGMVVINGEPLELVGAAKKEKIAIREVRTPLTAFGVEYPESYTTRYVEFSDNGEYEWAKFEPIPTNMELYDKIENITGDPAGVIKQWAGFIGKIPKDYMLCDGRELSKLEYPELFENLGTTYGGDGANSFRLPNLSGRVAVGYSGETDYKELGATGGADSVTPQLENIPKHRHIYTDDTNANGGWHEVEPNFPQMFSSRTDKTSASSAGTGAAYYTSYVGGDDNGKTVPLENRQPYIVIAYIIKVR